MHARVWHRRARRRCTASGDLNHEQVRRVGGQLSRSTRAAEKASRGRGSGLTHRASPPLGRRCRAAAQTRLPLARRRVLALRSVAHVRRQPSPDDPALSTPPATTHLSAVVAGVAVALVCPRSLGRWRGRWGLLLLLLLLWRGRRGRRRERREVLRGDAQHLRVERRHLEQPLELVRRRRVPSRRRVVRHLV